MRALAMGLWAAWGPLLAQAPLEPRGYVNDFAGVLTAETAAKVERLAGEVERKTGAQMSVVIVRTLGGEPIEDYANNLARRWGVGRKDNRGVLLLFALNERRTRVEVGYGLEPVLPDGRVGGILRSLRPALREGNFDQAVLLALAQLATAVAQASGVALEDPEAQRRPPPEPGPAPVDLPWWAIAGGALAVLWIASRFAKRPGRRGWADGTYVDPRPDPWGGAGRISRDSGWDGGGFGGFGGGDFGGGGASSDW